MNDPRSSDGSSSQPKLELPASKSYMSVLKRTLAKAGLTLVLGMVAICQTRPVRILEQPKPELPKNYGQLDAQGTIRLKVEFLANGRIGNIFLITRLPVANLDGLAIGAAKKIRFRPKLVDGRPVTSFRMVEYQYSWHGFWNVQK